MSVKHEEDISRRYEEAILDMYERAEEGDEALQEFWPQLEAVVNDEILARLNEVLTTLQFVQNIAVKSLGGIDRLLRLQNERDPDQT